MAKHDPVRHPAHYEQAGLQMTDVILKLRKCFLIGNALKYLWRAGVKGGKAKEIEDLEKAVWYVQRRIRQLKEGK